MTEEAPSDEPARQPASENPWYVLMTVAGPQDGETIDWDRHLQNQRYFNGWMAQALTEDDKQRLINQGCATAEDLAPLTDAEKREIARQLGTRCPEAARPDPSKSLVDLASCAFAAQLVCSGFIFPGGASFRYARFKGDANFEHATFLRDTDFDDTDFLRGTNFQAAKFEEGAYFRRAEFSRDALFQQAIFQEATRFLFAELKQDAHFQQAAFQAIADFEGATFTGHAFFNHATFSRASVFRNAKFKSPTKFENVTFDREHASPPQFSGATLHEETRWDGIKTWPLPGSGHNPADFILAYEKLKHLMDDQKKLDSEHMFHKLELQSKAIAETGTLASFASWLYRILSDYGWSIQRPAIGLGIVFALGWILIYADQISEQRFGDGEFLGGWTYGAVSLSNVFGFLGLGGTFLADDLKTLTGFSQVVSGLQTFFSLILIFLLGLALRNRFRIK